MKFEILTEAERIGKRCYFCGESRSVKYAVTVKIDSPTTMSKKVCACNACVCMRDEYKEVNTDEAFFEQYCKGCGSQRCEGPGSDWFDGCRLKKLLVKE